MPGAIRRAGTCEGVKRGPPHLGVTEPLPEHILFFWGDACVRGHGRIQRLGFLDERRQFWVRTTSRVRGSANIIGRVITAPGTRAGGFLDWKLYMSRGFGSVSDSV